MMFLALIHGRKDPSQSLEDWGSQGPVFRLEYLQSTYGAMTISLYSGEDTTERISLSLKPHLSGDSGIFCNEKVVINGKEVYAYDDLIKYDGIYYGDFIITDKENDIDKEASFFDINKLTSENEKRK